MQSFDIIESKNYSKINKFRVYSISLLLILLVIIRFLSFFEKNPNIRPFMDNIAWYMISFIIVLLLVVFISFIIMHNSKKIGVIQFIDNKLEIVKSGMIRKIQYSEIDIIKASHFFSEKSITDKITGSKRLKLTISLFSGKDLSFIIKIDSHFKSRQFQNFIKKINSDKY